MAESDFGTTLWISEAAEQMSKAPTTFGQSVPMQEWLAYLATLPQGAALPEGVSTASRIILRYEAEVFALQRERDDLHWQSVTYKAGKKPWVLWSFNEHGDYWTVLCRTGEQPDRDGGAIGQLRGVQAQAIANELNDAEYRMEGMARDALSNTHGEEPEETR